MQLVDTTGYPGEWLRGTGLDADVVVSSRVRLARNLTGELFPGRASAAERLNVRDRVMAALQSVPLGDTDTDRCVDLGDLDPIERVLLVERHLISKELAQAVVAKPGEESATPDTGKDEPGVIDIPLEPLITPLSKILEEQAAADTEGTASPGAASAEATRPLPTHPVDDVRASGRAVCFTSREDVALMINEEDHLRLQVIRTGFALDEAHALADGLDSRLSDRLPFAFHKTFGYLTACPTNCGTGLRASVMLHLPALAFRKTEIEKFLQAVNKMNLMVRGLYGEGSRPAGHFFQVSNQQTLGQSEEELLATLSRLARKVVEYERRTREHLMQTEKSRLEDRVWRALGTLQSARVITSEETMDLLSDLRLGVSLGILPLEWSLINELFVQTQPAHLQKMRQERLDSDVRDRVRSEYLRERLAAVPGA